MEVPILALLAGKTVPFASGESSAIAKVPLHDAIKIGFLGIVGDEQADPRYHGGPDKALHHYPFDHYAAWALRMPDHPRLSAVGAFGENISTLGLCEGDVCIGDRFRLGSAMVEISQGRQPCWKQGERMKWATLPALMVKERRSGWYYRVIEEGIVQAGDRLDLIDRPLPDWTVRRVFGLIIGGDHKRDPSALNALMHMEHLYKGWRARAAELTRLI
ncbi:MAG: MOSC domain-containing protein [Chakrabartia sp.]